MFPLLKYVYQSADEQLERFCKLARDTNYAFIMVAIAIFRSGCKQRMQPARELRDTTLVGASSLCIPYYILVGVQHTFVSQGAQRYHPWKHSNILAQASSLCMPLYCDTSYYIRTFCWRRSSLCNPLAQSANTWNNVSYALKIWLLIMPSFAGPSANNKRNSEIPCLEVQTGKSLHQCSHKRNKTTRALCSLYKHTGSSLCIHCLVGAQV